MSVVSTNTSNTAQIRNAAAENLKMATDARISLSTGVKFTHAHEDPTGYKIGRDLFNQLVQLGVVNTSLQQSQSMLYIAEDGIKSIQNVLVEIRKVVTRAKMGFMDDTSVKNDLAPTYNQLKAELNRIANSIEFNGQKLLNGTGGKVKAGVSATIDTSSVIYDIANSVSAFNQYGNNTANLGAFRATITDNNGDTTVDSAITVKPSGNSVTPKISGGTLTKNGNNFIISNAKLTIDGVAVTAGTKTATADLTISNVTLSFTGATMSEINGELTFNTAPTIAIASITANNVSFANVKPTGASPNGITSINTTGVTTAPTLTTGKISEIESEYTSSGGEGTISTFKFVTGLDLAKDIIEVDMPNLSLVDKPGVPGAISTLNTSGLKSTIMPTDLTELNTIADADIDIPIIEALTEEVGKFLSALGAYQLRFINLSEQLTTNIEQIDNAQGAIMDTDLLEETEVATRATVNLNIALQCFKDTNDILSSLQRIVTG